MKFLWAAVFLWLASSASAAEFDYPRPRPVARGSADGLFHFAAPQTPHPAVVRVIAPESGGASLGSGTLVEANDHHGLIVTNWHVVKDAPNGVIVVFPDGFQSPGVVVKTDRAWDLAAVVVWRPRATPVPISFEAPRPGEVLTIAGYGSGSYRAQSGHCTQYLSPGENLPFEIVELSASARQGDSGGPILNGNGELAGVLFGEGGGLTSGSYAGRVRRFLGDAGKQMQGTPPMIAANPSVDGKIPPLADPSAATDLAQLPTHAIKHHPPPATGAENAAVKPQPTALPNQPEVQHVGWCEIAGPSILDQIKTVLAIIGGIALWLQLTRWLAARA